MPQQLESAEVLKLAVPQFYWDNYGALSDKEPQQKVCSENMCETYLSTQAFLQLHFHFDI